MDIDGLTPVSYPILLTLETYKILGHSSHILFILLQYFVFFCCSGQKVSSIKAFKRQDLHAKAAHLVSSSSSSSSRSKNISSPLSQHLDELCSPRSALLYPLLQGTDSLRLCRTPLLYPPLRVKSPSLWQPLTATTNNNTTTMAERYIPEHRRNQFKAKAAFKPDELRRRREEQQVEIRRQKREENLAKRRGIQTRDGGIGVGGAMASDSEDEGGSIETEVRYSRAIRFLWSCLALW